MAEVRQVSSWRIILAFFLDVITSFLVLGYIISLIFGGTTENGFSLQGGSALLLLGCVIAYFVIFNRYLGGTIWKRILGAVR